MWVWKPALLKKRNGLVLLLMLDLHRVRSQAEAELGPELEYGTQDGEKQKSTLRPSETATNTVCRSAAVR
jgi:hypothetical protein